jgi:hypothetical protein
VGKRWIVWVSVDQVDEHLRPEATLLGARTFEGESSLHEALEIVLSGLPASWRQLTPGEVGAAIDGRPAIVSDPWEQLALFD